MGRFYISCCSVCIHSCSINLSAFGSFPALSLHSHQTLLFSFCLPLSLSLARPPSLCRCFHAFLYSFVTVFSVPRSLPFHVVPPLVALVLLSFFHLPLSVRPSIHSIYPTSPCFPPHFSISCLFLLFTRENSGPNLLSVSPSFSRVERRERAHFPRPQSHFALGLCRGEKRGIFGSQLGPRTPPTSTAAKKSVVRSRSVHRRCRRRAAGHME